MGCKFCKVVPELAVAKGDVISYDSGGVPVKLAVGANGKVLTADSGEVTGLKYEQPSPAGAIIMFGAAAAPTGWLLCDGAAVSRTTYAALFAAISTTWGVGDGSTTFNVPDFPNNFPVGSGDTYSIGDTGGSATHPLSTAELAAHFHTVARGANVWAGTNVVKADGTGADTMNTGSTGSGDAHENRPPYLAVPFIIKT